MTLDEAVDWVEQEILPVEIASGEIKRRISLQNKYVARDLRVPMQFIEDVDATTSFSLPVNATSNGVQRFYYQKTGETVPHYTVAEVSEQYPRWTEDTFQVKLIVYDPSNVSAPITPIGFNTGDYLRVLYQIVPAELNEGSDELLNGELSDHHDLIPRKVASEILISRPEEHLFRKGTMLRGEFDKQMKAAFAKGWSNWGMW